MTTIDTSLDTSLIELIEELPAEARSIDTSLDTSLIELIEELPAEARSEVRDFVEFLIAKQRRELARQSEANGWPKGFFESTAGSIPDLPNRDTHGLDSSLDETADELRFDIPEQAS